MSVQSSAKYWPVWPPPECCPVLPEYNKELPSTALITQPWQEYCRVLAYPTLTRVLSRSVKYWPILLWQEYCQVLPRIAKYWPIWLPPSPNDDLLRSCHQAPASLSHSLQSFPLNIFCQYIPNIFSQYILSKYILNLSSQHILKTL